MQEELENWLIQSIDGNNLAGALWQFCIEATFVADTQSNIIIASEQGMKDPIHIEPICI